MFFPFKVEEVINTIFLLKNKGYKSHYAIRTWINPDLCPLFRDNLGHYPKFIKKREVSLFRFR